MLATGFVVLFFGTGTRFAFGLMLVPMTEDLEMIRSELSAVVTTFMLVSALTMPIVGRLIDRHSIRVVMTIGAVISAAAVGLIGSVTAPWQVFVLYGVVYAVGFNATAVSPVSVLMSRWFPNNTGLASSAAIAGNGTGQLVIISLITSFLGTAGWRMSYHALGLLNGVVVIPLVALAVRSDPAQPASGGRPRGVQSGVGPERASSIRTVISSREFWLLAVMFAVCGTQDFFVATHVVAFAQDQGVSDALAGNILALMGLTALVGVLLSGALADRWGAVLPTTVCFLLRIGLFGFIPFVQGTPAIALFALVYGFTFTMTAPLTVVFARNIFGTGRLGTVSGLFSMVHQVAGGVGALVGAIIFDSTGSYDGAFFLMLALTAVAVVSTVLVRERGVEGVRSEGGEERGKRNEE